MLQINQGYTTMHGQPIIKIWFEVNDTNLSLMMVNVTPKHVGEIP